MNADVDLTRLTGHRTNKARWLAIGTFAVLLLAAAAVALPRLLSTSVEAVGGDFMVDFIAAAPDDYDHTTSPAQELISGELEFDARAINTHVVEQLQDGFECGDTIVYFTEVSVDSSALGSQTIDLHYEFDAINNGQQGVGYSDVVAVGLSAEGVFTAGQTTESGHSKNGNESAILQSGPTFFPGAGGTWDPGTSQTMEFTVRVNGLEASEAVIVRVDARFSCFASPTGTLHAAFDEANTVEAVSADNETINVGRQEITMLGLAGVPTVTPTETPTATSTTTPTLMLTSTPTDIATNTPTNTPTQTNTPPNPTAPTNTPTQIMAPPGTSSTATGTPPAMTPTAATATSTNSPTPIPSSTPTATPTDVQTSMPTPTAATQTPTSMPTATPTQPATATPTDPPTAVPNVVPTATPTFISEVLGPPPTRLPDTGGGQQPAVGNWMVLGLAGAAASGGVLSLLGVRLGWGSRARSDLPPGPRPPRRPPRTDRSP